MKKNSPTESSVAQCPYIKKRRPVGLLLWLLTFESLWLNPSHQYLESCLWLFEKVHRQRRKQEETAALQRRDRSVSSGRGLHTLLHLGLAGQGWAECQAVRQRELARMQHWAELNWSGAEPQTRRLRRLMTAWRTLAYSHKLCRNPFGRSNFPTWKAIMESDFFSSFFLIISLAAEHNRSEIIIIPQGPGTREGQHRSNRLKVRTI